MTPFAYAKFQDGGILKWRRFKIDQNSELFEQCVFFSGETQHT